MKLSITRPARRIAASVYPAVNHSGVDSCIVAGHSEAGMAGTVVVNK